MDRVLVLLMLFRDFFLFKKYEKLRNTFTTFIQLADTFESAVGIEQKQNISGWWQTHVGTWQHSNAKLMHKEAVNENVFISFLM